MYLEILFGFIFSFIFMKLKIFQKIEEHGPNSNKIIKEIYYFNKSKKYYKFTPEVCFHPL